VFGVFGRSGVWHALCDIGMFDVFDALCMVTVFGDCYILCVVDVCDVFDVYVICVRIVLRCICVI